MAMAIDVVYNAKLRRVSVCGSAETLLVHQDIAPDFLPQMAQKLENGDCALRGCVETLKILPHITPATEDDWSCEYLNKILSIKIVASHDEAIHHINHYGSHHTDSIISNDDHHVQKFMNFVDSAIVMHNTSTQFADGGEFGMGAEIGISTGRMHARGPVGIEQLTTSKYLVYGKGQTRP
jgi:glutamate-5-semialdehyde dehydrogenase